MQLLSGVSFGLPVGTCSRVPRGGKRAGDITTLRSQNEQKYMAKEQFYKQKWESIRNAQAQNACAGARDLA